MLIEYLEENFKFLVDHITDMTDAIATTNINCHVAKNNQVKTIFRNRKRLTEKEERDRNPIYVPKIGWIKFISNEEN